MGGVCGNYEREERCTQILGGEKLRERDYLEDLLIDERIILKWIFKKYDGSLVWIELAQDNDKWH